MDMAMAMGEGRRYCCEELYEVQHNKSKQLSVLECQVPAVVMLNMRCVSLEQVVSFSYESPSPRVHSIFRIQFHLKFPGRTKDVSTYVPRTLLFIPMTPNRCQNFCELFAFSRTVRVPKNSLEMIQDSSPIQVKQLSWL